MLRYFVKNEEPTALQELIDKIEFEMSELDVDSEEFTKHMVKLERLYEIKGNESPGQVSPDTLALVLGNLAGILLIVVAEHKHVMSSKGFGQLFRPKALGQ